jgi:hypothetical protein
VKFNINDTVRVRLTDYGRAVLREDWHSTTNIYYASPEQRAIRGEYKPPKEDEHGWSEWQLWALMEAFGEHTGNGCRLSFETEIEIVGSEVAKAEADLAALKAHDPLAEMWRELEEYQPMADANGHGEAWRFMCRERTAPAAERAHDLLLPSSPSSASEPWLAALSARWAIEWGETSRRNVREAIAAIRRAKEAKR